MCVLNMTISPTLYEEDRDLCCAGFTWLVLANTHHGSGQNCHNTQLQSGILMHYAQLDVSFSGRGMEGWRDGQHVVRRKKMTRSHQFEMQDVCCIMIHLTVMGGEKTLSFL